MTGQRVLVAYGSLNGATAGIAEEIAAILEKDGLAAEVRSAADVDDLSAYDAVVLGGGLYAGRWQHDARRFARRLKAPLRERPVWCFSSGPLDASATQKEIPPTRAVRRAISRIEARGHTTFGGRLDPHPEGRLARSMAKRGMAHDWRDFDQIRAWAHTVATDLRRQSRAPGDAGQAVDKR
ncbi:flavodoxin [Streptomyces rimosus subsp. pseudoverticillatus]|uniref:flavodoxin domain-containing protein n=1 Tax=Streptomyces rimosus TaxID=1927 RepID=UPI0006B2775D|nr:flavodoxin domain-containing protein [Streptomyces rimosus]KOT78627.1 flavodoxin [Streptomyces rimosus subsp. pseudoverticillatus]